MKSQNTTFATLIAASFGLVNAACSDTFLPASRLDGPRLLAVTANPIEIGPTDEVELSPVVYTEPGQTIEHSWTFCPLSIGAVTGFACISPLCEVPVNADANGRIKVQPLSLALDCFTALGNDGMGLGGGDTLSRDDIPASVETIFRYVGTVTDADGTESTVSGLTRVPWWTEGPPPSSNQPPQIASVSIGGMSATAGSTLTLGLSGDAAESIEVTVGVDAATLDPFINEQGEMRTEEPIVAYYTTNGQFDSNLTNGINSDNALEKRNEEPGPLPATMYIVVRDGRGGQTVGGPYRIE